MYIKRLLKDSFHFISYPLSLAYRSAHAFIEDFLVALTRPYPLQASSRLLWTFMSRRRMKATTRPRDVISSWYSYWGIYALSVAWDTRAKSGAHVKQMLGWSESWCIWYPRIPTYGGRWTREIGEVETSGCVVRCKRGQCTERKRHSSTGEGWPNLITSVTCFD